jgi:hypothetical protein
LAACRNLNGLKRKRQPSNVLNKPQTSGGLSKHSALLSPFQAR